MEGRECGEWISRISMTNYGLGGEVGERRGSR